MTESNCDLEQILAKAERRQALTRDEIISLLEAGEAGNRADLQDSPRPQKQVFPERSLSLRLYLFLHLVPQ